MKCQKHLKKSLWKFFHWMTAPFPFIYVPVSYTHLDVYKRQAQRLSRLWRSYAGSLPAVVAGSNGLCSSLAVSYTHLDVYKRQLLFPVDRQLHRCRVAYCQHMLGRNFLLILVCRNAVSYTHLDVYKRQLYDRLALRLDRMMWIKSRWCFDLLIGSVR